MSRIDGSVDPLPSNFLRHQRTIAEHTEADLAIALNIEPRATVDASGPMLVDAAVERTY